VDASAHTVMTAPITFFMSQKPPTAFDGTPRKMVGRCPLPEVGLAPAEDAAARPRRFLRNFGA
jgi:hypothetical protein